MIGLTILLAFAVYLLISFFVVRFTIRWAKRRGRSAWRWGIASTLFMYLVMFWDHIPTYVMCKYYCNTRSGFWVFKTTEQWKTENSKATTTINSPIRKSFRNDDTSWGTILNARFIWLHEKEAVNILPIYIDTESIVDIKTGEKVAILVSVWSGYSGTNQYARFWANFEPCNVNRSKFEYYVVKYSDILKD